VLEDRYGIGILECPPRGEVQLDALPAALERPGDVLSKLECVHLCPPRVVEFTKVATWMAIGFVVMGFVGFFVKLIFIPINIIVGSG
jgi:hypothetical protein